MEFAKSPDMDPPLEHMARMLLDSGDYRILRRLEPQAEYHQADDGRVGV